MFSVESAHKESTVLFQLVVISCVDVKGFPFGFRSWTGSTTLIGWAVPSRKSSPFRPHYRGYGEGIV